MDPQSTHVPVLDGSYKRALPFEMIEVRKETGRDDSQLTLGLLTNLISSAARSDAKSVDHFGHNG